MDKLIKKLDPLKDSVDAIKSWIDPYRDALADLSRITVRTIELKQTAIQNCVERYDRIYEDISLLVNDQHQVAVAEQRTKYFEFINNTASVDSDLELVKNRLPNPVVQQQQLLAQQNNNNHGDWAKLPKRELKKFEGNVLDWPEFSDNFTTEVINCPKFTDCQKMGYLKSCLDGEAGSMVKNLKQTAENFKIAWDLLKERYEDSELIRDAHFEKLFTIKLPTEQSATSLRKLSAILIENLQGLKNLKEPTDKWDSWIIYFIKYKFDSITRKDWETYLVNNKLKNPIVQNLVTFLHLTARTLETCQVKQNVKKSAGDIAQKSSPSPSYRSLVGREGKFACYVCEHNHFMSSCPLFLAVSPQVRKDKVVELGLCLNCFSRAHKVAECEKPVICKLCPGKLDKHHSSLHQQEGGQLPPTTKRIKSFMAMDSTGDYDQIGESDADSETEVMTASAITTYPVLLSTVLVRVTTHSGIQICRCLVDSGSQASFITKACVQRLGIKTGPSSMKVTGIGSDKCHHINKCTHIELCSTYQDSNGQSYDSIEVKLHVMNKITSLVPKNKLNINFSDMDKLALADPHFCRPGRIDILLGMDVYPEILTDVSPFRKNGLFLQNTIFGWMVGGQISQSAEHGHFATVHTAQCESTDQLLTRFWKLDDCNIGTKPWSIEEKKCEQYFKDTHAQVSIKTRDYLLTEERYQVCLPMKSDKTLVLGNSKKRAMALYKKMEKRWERNSNLENGHRANIEEYFELEHAEEVPDEDKNKPDDEVYFLSQSCVQKLTSTTTQYRGVYDGSGKSTTGVSINSKLMIGPNLQQSVFQILARFKTHKVAFTADIAKMYRQMSIAQQDRDFLRFLYRRKNETEIKEYRMTRVTFGIASSAHHAQRCLLQLCEDEAERYPLACEVIKRDMYMDDCLSGAANAEDALTLQSQLLDCLATKGFHLRKWASNEPQVLEAVPENDREQLKSYDLDLDLSRLKTLGVHWCPITDKMSYVVKPLENLDHYCYTKRYLIADTSRVFDPLGTLAPTIMKAKLIFKDLWRAGVDWDEPMPSDIMDIWLKWRKDLENLKEFSFDRCIIPNRENAVDFQLQGFSDASELGIAAVVYLRTIYSDGEIEVRQVAAKTKVAPMKTVTVPRLELCAAYLLSNLMVSTKNALELPNVSMYAWSDSTVTLHWINGDPGRWKTFVARRVSEIQDNVPPSCWRHCPTSLNPADCASRSLMPSQLMDHELWWYGPEFLKLNENSWPQNPITSSSGSEVMSEAKTVKLNSCIVQQDRLGSQLLLDLFPYSSLDKIIRMTAWCLRWRIPKNLRPVGSLTVNELNSALLLWIMRVQSDTYSEEIAALKSEQALPKKCNLLPLCPFLDEHGVLRVGGRLKNSNLAYSAKHQILLPRQHCFTSLVIEQIHRRNLHATPRWMLAILRQKYWVVNAMEILRWYCHKCVLCRRARADTLQQIMGDLPAVRVQPSARAFLKTGVDYAGHYFIKSKLGRNPIRTKVWIAFFVCLSCKACHIEIVSSLDTDHFLAAFRRFVSRRGLVTDMYSDNATTFHGADNELHDFINSLDTNEVFAKALSKDKIQWHYSPQKGSHFGGLWESGIKNMKTLLNSELSGTILTYEELLTLTCQIEACLNSRPITELSADPNDLDYLTPGHFLIGAPLTAVPEPDLTGIKLNRLDRWQLIQSMFQKIWKRYSTEYLHSLQQRRKWLETGRNVQINDVVLMKDEDLPSLKWRLARVVDLHPGADGIVRVVTVKTATSTYKRPIVKLSLLIPSEDL